MSEKNRLRKMAQDISVYERVVLKRWLQGHGGFSDHSGDLESFDIEYLSNIIRDRGGDPELLCARGREWGVMEICKKHGLDVRNQL